MIVLKRVSLLLCVLTFGLIIWGSHVNTTNSGMAFPDWPTSNANAMVTYSPAKWLWQGDQFWEHGHRLFATLVGLVTTALVVLSYRATPTQNRPNKTIAAFFGTVFVIIGTALVGLNPMITGFMETFMVILAIAAVLFLYKSVKARHEVRVLWLSLAAFSLVCLQGAFGGYTVRNNLPWWTSTIHGVLAEVFLMVAIGIAFLVVRAGSTEKRTVENRTRSYSGVVFASWGFLFIQFLLGALTRHTHAWGASVHWPAWSPEGFLPSADMITQPQVLIQFVHRTFAYAVAIVLAVQWFVVRNRSKSTTEFRLANPKTLSTLSMLLVFGQIALGVAVLTTFRSELITTLHVLVGALLLVINTIMVYVVAGSPSAQHERVHTGRIVGEGRR